jgi:hypothetical protein
LADGDLPALTKVWLQFRFLPSMGERMARIAWHPPNRGEAARRQIEIRLDRIFRQLFPASDKLFILTRQMSLWILSFVNSSQDRPDRGK